MNVAMFQLFCGSITNVSHLNIKVQGLSGQWVIAIDSDVVAIYFSNTHNLNTFRCFSLELHAYFDIVHALEHSAWYNFSQCRIVLTISICSIQGNVQLIANYFAFQCILQAGNDVLLTMQVSQWIAAFGRVDSDSGIVGKCEMN